MAYAFQNKLLYPAPNYPVLEKLPAYAKKITLGDSYGYLLTSENNSAKPSPLVIFSHGNGELIDMWVSRFQPLLNNNIAVLLVEYPGYGVADGETSLVTINETMLNAYDTVSTLPYIDENKIIAYGRSIGGGAAALLAKQRPLMALALESTFSDLPSLVAEKFPLSFLLKDRYNNTEIVAALNIPIFIYHGVKDQIIPFSHAKILKKAAKMSTFYSEVCGHNDCPRKWQAFILFLQSNDHN